MSYCNKCGSVLIDGAKFCHECGAKQSYLINSIKKINFAESDPIDVQATEHIRKKKLYDSIKVGILAGLIILSLAFGSYYLTFSIFSAINTKKSNTYSKLTPKSNNDFESDVTTTLINKNQSKASKVDDSTNSVTSKINSSDDYIFTKSGEKKLLDSDLSSLSKEKLALVRNEIFARHGYVFEEEPYKSYFKGKLWYKPNPNFKEKDEELNNIEKYNVQLILKYEKE